MTTLSYPFFKYVHQEPADLQADPFKVIEATKSKDPWDSNQALPTLLFARAHNKAEVFRRIPNLKMRTLDWASVAAYPLERGV